MEARDRIEPWLVVELRRRAEQAEEQSVRVVAALREIPARVRVREVAAERQTVSQTVRRVEAERRSVEIVVRAYEHALVMVVVARQIERGAIVTAADRDDVVEDVPGVESLAGVVVRGHAGQRRPP